MKRKLRRKTTAQNTQNMFSALKDRTKLKQYTNIHLNQCISCLRLPSQIATNWIVSNNMNLFSLSCGGWKSELRHQQASAFSEGSREEHFLASLAFGGCRPSLVFLDSQLHHSNFCFHLHMISSLCVCPLSKFPFYKDSSH